MMSDGRCRYQSESKVTGLNGQDLRAGLLMDNVYRQERLLEGLLERKALGTVLSLCASNVRCDSN